MRSSTICVADPETLQGFGRRSESRNFLEHRRAVPGVWVQPAQRHVDGHCHVVNGVASGVSVMHRQRNAVHTLGMSR